MASAWGSSWGTAWGVSWDIPVVVAPSTTATLIRNATGYAFITTTPTAYANITVSPGTLDVEVED
jgi:hypothetical protein